MPPSPPPPTVYYHTGWASARFADLAQPLPISHPFYSFRPSTNRYQKLVTVEKQFKLNRVQLGFIAWNAERLKIPQEDSMRRYLKAQQDIKRGHGGHAFRMIIEQQYHLLNSFAGDSRREVYDAYRIHAPLQTLRFVSYGVTARYPKKLPPLLLSNASLPRAPGEPLVIVEFGAGLGHTSLSLAEELRVAAGMPIELHLYDIATPRFELLKYLCVRDSLPCVLHDASAGPVRLPPRAHCVIAQEVVEHLYADELQRLQDELLRSLVTGGVLVTNLIDHKQEFMHVAPQVRPSPPPTISYAPRPPRCACACLAPPRVQSPDGLRVARRCTALRDGSRGTAWKRSRRRLSTSEHPRGRLAGLARRPRRRHRHLRRRHPRPDRHGRHLGRASRTGAELETVLPLNLRPLALQP